MALEVKILCHCGSKYKFDVEPLHGRMPGPVRCPACNAEGTDEGNRVIAQLLTPVAAGINISGAVPIMIGAMPPPTVTPTSPVRSSGGGPTPVAVPKSSAEYRAAKQTETAAPAATAQPAVAPRSLSPQLPPPGPSKLGVQGQNPPSAPVAAVVSVPGPSAPPSLPVTAAPKQYQGGIRVGMGMSAAIGTALVGAIIFYIVLAKNVPFAGYAAWGLGAIIGLASHKMARGGNQALGWTAAIAATLAILLAQFLGMQHFNNARQEAAYKIIDEMYSADFALGKKATAARTDADLKAVIAQDNSDESTKVKAAEVTDAEVDDFKKTRLPELKKISSGSLSKTAFRQEHEDEIDALLASQKRFRFRRGFGVSTIIFLLFGVGAAFHLAAKP